VDLLEAADGRTVEGHAVLERVFGQDVRGIVKCCQTPGRSVKRRSTICTLFAISITSATVLGMEASFLAPLNQVRKELCILGGTVCRGYL